MSAAERCQAEREQRQQADFQRYVYMRERNGVRLTKYESNPSVRQAYNISSSCARPFPPELTQRQSDVLPPTAQSRGQTDAAATFVLLSAAALAANAASPLPFARQAGPASVSDGGCSAAAIVTPTDAQTLGLANLGPSKLSIVDAGGGSTPGLSTTRIEINEATGETGPATVAQIQRSLEGIGKYADKGYVIVYHPEYEGVSVHQKEDIVIDWSRPPIRTGWRDRQDKLWHWSLRAPLGERVVKWLQHDAPRVQPSAIDNLPSGTVAVANNVYELPSLREGVRFMHAVCGYPVKSTWLKAIRNNHYVGWPLLTVTNVNKHYPETLETPRGHLNVIPAGRMSTKPPPEPLEEAAEADLKKAFNKKEQDVFIKVWNITDAVHSDQTGKFPVQSRSHNNYIMIMCHVDSNAVLGKPMKNRSAKEMIRAYRALITKLRRAGFITKKHAWYIGQ